MDIMGVKIVSLIDNKIGDCQRLNEMLHRSRSGKPLYNSDIDYIEKIFPTTTISEVEENPINLDELRKSKPKPKYKVKPTKFAVSYSNSRRGSAKIHRANCHNVYRSSQEGDIKWIYFDNYSDANDTAQRIGMRQPYGWKYAGCCMNGFPINVIIGSIITCIFLGILGGLIAWYFTRDYFNKWARTWLVLGGIESLIFAMAWIVRQI